MADVMKQMRAQRKLSDLKVEMDKLEAMSYEELDNLPWVVKNVAKGLIDEIMKKLEAQNKIVKQKFKEVEDELR